MVRIPLAPLAACGLVVAPLAMAVELAIGLAMEPALAGRSPGAAP